MRRNTIVICRKSVLKLKQIIWICLSPFTQTQQQTAHLLTILYSFIVDKMVEEMTGHQEVMICVKHVGNRIS